MVTPTLSLMYIIYHIPWCVLINNLDLFFLLTRHPFRLPCLARPLFHIFLFHAFRRSLLRHHMKRCAQVAPIHLLVKMPQNWRLNPGIFQLDWIFALSRDMGKT